jgi:hypothetical protein
MTQLEKDWQWLLARVLKSGSTLPIPRPRPYYSLPRISSTISTISRIKPIPPPPYQPTPGPSRHPPKTERRIRITKTVSNIREGLHVGWMPWTSQARRGMLKNMPKLKRPGQPDLADLHHPYRELSLSLPDWLDTISAAMRAGTWSPASEALLIVNCADHEGITTVLYWGEDTGLTSDSVLGGIAELNRKQ